MFRVLRVRNFLSLKNVDLKLGKLNVFVGPNASGKSNIVKVFRFVSDFVHGKSTESMGFRSFKELAYNFDESVEVCVEFNLSIDDKEVCYTLRLHREGYLERVELNGTKVLEYDGETGECWYFAKGGKKATKSVQDHFTYFDSVIPPSCLSKLPPDVINEIRVLADMLKSVRVYSFLPPHIREASRVRDPPVLGYYGENLARVLLHLFLEDRRRYINVEGVLRSMVPCVEEVVPHIEGEDVFVLVREKGLRKPVGPAGISDGTLRLLAFIVSLYGGSSVVGFEEPENCVHPYLLEAIVDLARKASCQTIITTHSPYLLDHCRVDEVYAVDRRGVETVVLRLTDHKELERVKRLLEEGGTLGEAWYSGFFGGNP